MMSWTRNRHIAPCLLLLALLFGPGPAARGQDQAAGKDLTGHRTLGRYWSILVKKPRRSPVFDRWYDLKRKLFGAEALTKSLEDERATRPKDPALVIVLGLVHERLGDSKQALHLFREARRLAPDDWYPVYLTGDMLRLEGSEDAAARVLESCLDLQVEPDSSFIR